MNEEKDGTFQCFIHAVSPVKKGASSGKKYFNCTLQAKDTVVRAVCFNTERHSEISNVQRSKSPVRLQNIRINDNNGKKDVIILKQTNIVPLASINCTYSEEISDSAMLTNIASMQQVAAEQLVCLKVEVAHVQAVKTINTHHGSALKKQELIVRDPTGFIKLILWEDYVDCLQQHKTYHLQNVRVKVSKDEKYINTPKSEKFSFDEVEKFERDLVPIENDMVSLTMATVHGKIVGVMNVSKSVVCISCFKKVTPKTDKVGNCESCKVMQFLNSCPCHWYLRVLVQTNENKKLRLSMFNQCVQSLVELLGSENCDLKNISEDDLMLYILESEKSFVIDYETDHSKITSIKAEPSA